MPLLITGVASDDDEVEGLLAGGDLGEAVWLLLLVGLRLTTLEGVLLAFFRSVS